MRKIVYIGFAFDHHKGRHAGYHQIRDYVNYNYYIDCNNFIAKRYSMPKNYFERKYRHICLRIFGVDVFPWYILKCILLGIIFRNLTFHFIYGENTYVNFTRFIRKGNRVVCTFHQPFQWFLENQWENKLSKIDRIILVGKSELSKFRKIVGKDKVVFIPHGICTDFYHPDNTVSKEHLLLTVGNWLRDYHFADKVYRQLLNDDHELKITVVAMPTMTSSLHHHFRLQCLSNISDEQLRDLYRRCELLFLPLKRYTANNSLLEAAACGCNIVIASEYQDNSYIPSQYITLCNMNANEVQRVVRDLLQFPKKNNIADYIRHSYSWEAVGECIESFLKTLTIKQSIELKELQ